MDKKMLERKADGIAYYVGEWPLDSQKSTIIFIHGSGGSGHFWRAQVEGLSERVNTVSIDLPGHGNSEGDGLDRVEDYARVVADCIQKINPPNPIPCGLSLGGAITQQLLIDYKDLIKAGVLIGTGSRLKVMPLIFETIEKDYAGYVNMVGSLAASEKTDPVLLAPFKEETERCKPEVVHGDFSACNSFDVTDRLAAIDVPVLVVTAEDDKLTPPKYGVALEQGIKNATRSHIMEAGHVAPIEKPDEVNRAIGEFLDGAGL